MTADEIAAVVPGRVFEAIAEWEDERGRLVIVVEYADERTGYVRDEDGSAHFYMRNPSDE